MSLKKISKIYSASTKEPKNYSFGRSKLLLAQLSYKMHETIFNPLQLIRELSHRGSRRSRKESGTSLDVESMQDYYLDPPLTQSMTSRLKLINRKC